MRALLAHLASVQGHEVAPLLHAFGALFCVLASYFCSMPLREAAGISLGTSALPALFVAGMLTTLAVAPAASAFLSRRTARHREGAVRALLLMLAAALLGFLVLYKLEDANTSVQQLGGTHQPAAASHGWAGGGPTAHRRTQGSHASPASPAPAEGAARGAGAWHASQSAAQQGGVDGAASGPASVRGLQQHSSAARAQRWLRGSFYVAANAINLVAISAVWTRCADVFSPSAGRRLFGVISAGATLGQLAGSLVTLAASSSSRWLAGRGGRDAKPYTLLLLSAALMAAAGALTAGIRPPAEAPAMQSGAQAGRERVSKSGASLGGGMAAPLAAHVGSRRGTGSGLLAPAAADAPPAERRSPSPLAARGARAPPGRSGAGSYLRSFQVVAASPYLRLLCAWGVVTYVTTSLQYFIRTLIVARELHGFNSRASFLASLSANTAALILGAQLFATGRLLHALGPRASLLLMPAVSIAGTCLVAACPSAASVALAEVTRKLAGYAVNRPMRELLFTVLGRQEKYESKVVIDTVVQRLGDSVAAAAFELVEVRWHWGVPGVAGLAALGSAAWVVLSLRLAPRFLALQAAAGLPQSHM